MGLSTSDGEEEARHLAVIAESDEVLLDLDGSCDPVAVRRVAEALKAKGKALRLLERYEEYVIVCDQILAQPDQIEVRRLRTLAMKAAALAELHATADAIRTIDEVSDLFDDLGQPEQLVKLAASLAQLKVQALGRLDRAQDAICANKELINRFADRQAASPEVSMALCDICSRLLRDPERFEEAMAASESLKERILNEPDETLALVALIVLEHLRVIEAISTPTPGGVAVGVGLFLGNLAISALESGQDFMSRHQPALTSSLLGSDRLDAAVSLIRPLAHSRRRLRQCVVVSQAVTQRIGASEDPELRRLDAVAQTNGASALTILGHLREGGRALGNLSRGDDPGAPHSFETLANATDGSTLIGRLTRLGFLRMRAEALGRGDNTVAQVAFDDSVNAVDLDIKNSRPLRWASWLLRFTSHPQIVVPDHLPEPAD